MVEIIKENLYLLQNSKHNCQDILKKSSRSNHDIIDFLINLHLALELGLNCFYRYLILAQLKTEVKEKISFAYDLDKVSFIDKSVMFFVLPYFEFPKYEDIEQAENYYSAIGKLRNFSEIRNKLLHGHMNAQITFANGKTGQSKASELISEQSMQKQIENFKFIINAVAFYFDHLKSSLTDDGKERLKKQFLATDFLN